ncbi:MAG: haloacid dehalogenase type II [Streptosporangiales bacterium]|nr:haloacid dehalogenase type II [Streptosporangiales bacterium]
MPADEIEALAFDVFGTVVDWRSGITEAFTRVGDRAGISADWPSVADAWRRRYRPTLDRVTRGELAWQNFDGLHRIMLDDVLAEHGLDGSDGLGEADREEMVRAWHGLPPWPDAVPGLTRLRERFILSTLSNGHVAMLVHLAKGGGLPFDCILSVELVGTYKPDPEVYRSASRFLDLPPERVLMVACHPYDLRAAAAEGMRTGFVTRPLEWGPDTRVEPPPEGVDLVAEDFNDLAARLGC